MAPCYEMPLSGSCNSSLYTCAQSLTAQFPGYNVYSAVICSTPARSASLSGNFTPNPNCCAGPGCLCSCAACTGVNEGLREGAAIALNDYFSPNSPPAIPVNAMNPQAVLQCSNGAGEVGVRKFMQVTTTTGVTFYCKLHIIQDAKGNQAYVGQEITMPMPADFAVYGKTGLDGTYNGIAPSGAATGSHQIYILYNGNNYLVITYTALN
jgi:hypothetical protein